MKFYFTYTSQEVYVNFQETRRPCLLEVMTEKGDRVTVLLGHGRWASKFKFSQEMWEKADYVVCCHPHNLLPAQREKHVFPNHGDILHGSIRAGVWEIKPGYKHTKKTAPSLLGRPTR